MKRWITVGLLAAAVLLPQPAQASDNLTSSMTALCVGPFGSSCQRVMFTLDVQGAQYLEKVTLFSNGVVWKFLGLFRVLDRDGNDVTAGWNPKTATNTAAFSAVDQVPYTAEPVSFEMDFEAGGFGSSAELSSITYTANGYTNVNGTQGFFSTQGTVTPEPATVILLATGMLALAAVGYRRRRFGQPESAAA